MILILKIIKCLGKYYVQSQWHNRFDISCYPVGVLSRKISYILSLCVTTISMILCHTAQGRQGQQRLVYIVDVFKAIMPTVTIVLRCQCYCTCLGHLGRRDRDRIISISVASPRVAKTSTRVSLTRVVVAGIIALTLANVNTA